MKVSVIIPVYNAEKYLCNAVESAICIPEVEEVILVEDNSPDNALILCYDLEKQYEKVKVFRHLNGENRGAGASRNLGIKKASCELIAFLDADDWYLPNRFEVEKEILKNPDIDGVYGGTGFYVEGIGIVKDKLTTFNRKIPYKELLFNLVSLKGRFTTNAITIRKKIFLQSGDFNTSLILHQDTDLWYRLANFGKFVPGNIDKAIAIRRVHEENRITKKSIETRTLMHKAVFKNFINYKSVDKRSMQIIVNRYVHAISNNYFNKIFNYIRIFLSHPHLLKVYLWSF